jgi:hypothetical protein
MTDHLSIWRTRARWFAAEFLVVVTGVLVALALNAMFQARQDARNESKYLALLSRDMKHTTAQLEEKAAFEAAQLHDGVAAYRALSGSTPPEKPVVVSAALSKLTVRRTVTLRDAAYEDLLATGNLRLIRNRELRDDIVEFYGTTHAEFEIMNRNNSFYVDELYTSFVVGKGLIKPGVVANLAAAMTLDAELAVLLRPGYVDEPDMLWSLPANALEWTQLKSTLLMRIRVAAASEQFAQQILQRTRALHAALDAERKR